MAKVKLSKEATAKNDAGAQPLTCNSCKGLIPAGGLHGSQITWTLQCEAPGVN